MVKVVQLKTPHSLETHLWLNGALVRLSDLTDALLPLDRDCGQEDVAPTNQKEPSPVAVPTG